ncbi:hypothetical protein NC652_035177 [Populus alba x Populus x berolinensis]|uniref:Uncharacterized protein n=1 Tax=Populus alba x Populus x berolinensis TaxID=444605 RepID=A0AAD6PYJ9_9ROSI|nr:hypothetical protein NC652_035177 [Populus alba x Populus x berolinensis]KAJ6970673.1 hypothetical protein NC653_035068 [Populus alba x Populus x berolinensis]
MLALRNLEIYPMLYVTALGFVDHFLSCNDMNVSPGTALKKTVDKEIYPGELTHF